MRHMIQLLGARIPGDALPMETTVPAAVAVNLNTLRPETTEELRADTTINPFSIPEAPVPFVASGLMVDTLAHLAQLNKVPADQHAIAMTIYNLQTAVHMEKEKQAVEKEKQAVEKEKQAVEKEKQATADKQKAVIIEETRKIAATLDILNHPDAGLLRHLKDRATTETLSPISLEEMARDPHQPVHITGRHGTFAPAHG